MLRLVRRPDLILRPGLSAQVAADANTPLERCMECAKCSGGCPVAFAMDYLPNQVVHLVRLGLGQKALESAAIWLCASCETCTTRCPMGIDLAAVMDALRKEARAAGIVGGRVGVFHDTFLSSVKRYGRAHEIGLVGALKVKTKDFFSDLGLGVKMFLKGKFSLLPQRVKGIEQVREAFRK